MSIGIASDHAGFALKEAVRELFKTNYSSYNLSDYGCDNSEQSVDYPLVAQKLCQDILDQKLTKGILICGSGIGISIAANRHKGIRAALCSDVVAARLSREHNDANILCMGNWFVTPKMAGEIIEVWLNTEFAAGRHEKRIKQLDQAGQI